MTTIRASSMDQLFLCPPSVLDDTMQRIGSSHPAATVGKIVHDMAADFVSDKKFDVEGTLVRNGLSPVDADEYYDLMGYIVRVWEQELGKYFADNVTVEAQLGADGITVGGQEYKLTGTVDVACPISHNEAIFLDWKTGFLDGYHHQMSAYAYLLWRFMDRPSDIAMTGVTVFARQRFFRVVKYTAAILSQWEYDLTHNILSNADRFTPGSQCTYCEIRHECDARQMVVGSTLQSMGLPIFSLDPNKGAEYRHEKAWNDGMAALTTLTPEIAKSGKAGHVLAELLYRLDLASSAVDEAKEMVRQATENCGPIRLADGMELVMAESERRELIPELALPVLRAELSDSQICSAMRLGLTALLDKAAEQQKRGEKAAAKRALADRLDQANAIRRNTYRRLTKRPVAKTEGADNGDTGSESAREDD